MRLLLDTHIWLWMNEAPEELSAKVRKSIENPATELFLSVASAWEIGIKWQLGKLKLPDSPDHYVPMRLKQTLVESLPIEMSHALLAAQLPNHHSDPFDRLLIAQAKIIGLPIVTVDAKFKAYDVTIIWGA